MILAQMPDYVSTEEAARELGYHVAYIRKMARTGKLGAEPGGRDGGPVRRLGRAATVSPRRSLQMIGLVRKGRGDRTPADDTHRLVAVA